MRKKTHAKAQKKIEKLMGVSFDDMEQGSPEWLQLRLGVISASECDELLAGAKTDKKKKYIGKKLGEIMSGVPGEMFNAKATQWGKDNEGAARSAYEFVVDEPIAETPFIFKDETLRTGISPDGLLLKAQKGIEIKCPVSQYVYPMFLVDGVIKKEWEKQMQFQMWVTGCETWDFVLYDPRIIRKNLLYKTVEQDPKVQILITEAVEEVTAKIDECLNKHGYEFGDQWKEHVEVAKRGLK